MIQMPLDIIKFSKFEGIMEDSSRIFSKNDILDNLEKIGILDGWLALRDPSKE